MGWDVWSRKGKNGWFQGAPVAKGGVKNEERGGVCA